MNMSKNTIILLSVLAVVFIFFGSLIGTYNNLQALDEAVTSNWAQVENQLQRRNDLIPNLVNTVKGYAAHEKGIFTEVAEARAKLSGAVSNKDVKGVESANKQFNGALSRLLAIAENYPQLKADQNFIALQDEIAGTENRLAVARMDYNNSVQTLNSTIRKFPASIIANMSGIKAREYFKIEEQTKEVPQVKF